MFACKSIYEVTSALAKRLGFGDAFTENKSEQDWLRECVKVAQAKDPQFPSFEDFRSQGIYKAAPTKPLIAYAKQVDDPVHHPFKTPSGKIEIFSPRLWEKNNTQEIPAVPKYVPAWEGPESLLTAKYPLQCIGYHCKRRIHSTFDNNPWMEEVEKQEVYGLVPAMPQSAA